VIDLGLEGRVAIVTGASRGLGLAVAVALADQGVDVLAVARDEAALQKLADSRPSQIVVAPCDVRDLAAVELLPQRALAAFGRLDVVVNNAGIAPAGAFLDASTELLTDVLAVNVVAPAVLARAAGKHLIEQQSGKIINIASISGIRGKATLVAYSASKGALLQLTRALAAEWARYGVQVNAIAPGGFATEAQAYVLNTPEILARRVRKIPAGRMAEPHELAPLVCYLASPASDFVTGSVMVIDGGETAKI
jgi:2-deoxy-D-gluconate 3-dehydrogenase